MLQRSRMWLNLEHVLACSSNFSDVYKCSRTRMHVLKCFRLFSDVFEYFQIVLKVLKNSTIKKYKKPRTFLNTLKHSKTF